MFQCPFQTDSGSEESSTLAVDALELPQTQPLSQNNSQPVEVRELEVKGEGQVVCDVLVYSGH